MVIFRCMAKDFWLEKVVMPFENYIFDAPKDADVEIMGLDKNRISVKATTSEKLGFTGREEGIASLATAVVSKVE